MELRKESSEGEEAKRILDSAVFKDAMQTLANGYQDQWMNSDVDDVKKRESVFVKLNILADFVNELQTVLQTGQMADEQLRQEDKPRSTVN
ncbi:uncharacterized protein METZ01_LOCUS420735 [marine metagenome]|uniref:Uncharacterized protein n=1 Tax=marine metagenome TaxID=408172 RepID=A0A382XC15_9ZZZZ|tara:strand:- start:216 stop:488 length:273 start_codon:yes stop_codon:yes gene_type:complete